jgi:hypothetical protein
MTPARLLDDTLRRVVRRYRLPPLDTSPAAIRDANPAAALALSIEAVRKAIESGRAPDAESKRGFIDALARMIRDAMRPDCGDPAFQAMVLRHQVAEVREYAALSAQAAQDRRTVRAAAAAIAHPRKQERARPGAPREALARFYAAASAESVSALCDAVQALSDMPETEGALTRLRDGDALKRLLRAEALERDERVRRYRALWERNGPRPGSATAVAQGVVAQRRGADTEASAARALDALAIWLEEEEAPSATYRVVTSMRVPAALAAGHAHAKTEWDAVLLRRAKEADDADAWDVCLLVEAKASADAAATDFTRLVRGLRLLARAEQDIGYAFETREGTVRLRGTSLSALATDEAALERTVLYSCDASGESAPRLLSAAVRMRLLTTPASLDYASAPMDAQRLEPVWNELLESPQWTSVLDQSPTLHRVRELMIHPDDLLEAVEASKRSRINQTD